MTPRDKAILEQVYEHRSTPSAEIRNALALQLGVLPRQVQVWFQNKRQRSLSKRDTKALNVINATPSTVQAVTPVGLAIHASAVPGPSAVTPEAQSSAAQTRAVDVSLLQADPSEVQPVPLQTHTIDVPTASIPHAMRRNSTSDSLTDLAEVAERVGSIEHLTGGLERVSSLKDIAEFSRVGSLGLCRESALSRTSRRSQVEPLGRLRLIPDRMPDAPLDRLM